MFLITRVWVSILYERSGGILYAGLAMEGDYEIEFMVL